MCFFARNTYPHNRSLFYHRFFSSFSSISLFWTVSKLIAQRENEENLQREAELRLEAEQAERAAEDARLRELYPLPEDDQEYGEEQFEEEAFSDDDQLKTVQEERKRWHNNPLLCVYVFHVEKHLTGNIF